MSIDFNGRGDMYMLSTTRAGCTEPGFLLAGRSFQRKESQAQIVRSKISALVSSFFKEPLLSVEDKNVITRVIERPYQSSENSTEDLKLFVQLWNESGVEKRRHIEDLGSQLFYKKESESASKGSIADQRSLRYSDPKAKKASSKYFIRAGAVAAVVAGYVATNYYTFNRE